MLKENLNIELISRITGLNEEEINKIELKESFKLGFKEAYIYFKSMDMIKI